MENDARVNYVWIYQGELYSVEYYDEDDHRYVGVVKDVPGDDEDFKWHDVTKPYVNYFYAEKALKAYIKGRHPEYNDDHIVDRNYWGSVQ